MGEWRQFGDLWRWFKDDDKTRWKKNVKGEWEQIHDINQDNVLLFQARRNAHHLGNEVARLSWEDAEARADAVGVSPFQSSIKALNIEPVEPAIKAPHNEKHRARVKNRPIIDPTKSANTCNRVSMIDAEEEEEESRGGRRSLMPQNRGGIYDGGGAGASSSSGASSSNGAVVATQEPGEAMRALARPAVAVVELFPTVGGPGVEIMHLEFFKEMLPADHRASPAFEEHPMNFERRRDYWDLQYFREYYVHCGARVTARKDHNRMMKSTRDIAEQRWGTGAMSIHLSNDEPAAHMEIEHIQGASNRAPNYTMLDKWTPWSWREFIAAIDDRTETAMKRGTRQVPGQSDLQMVVTGPKGDARGITEMRLESDPNTYDHNRQVRNPEAPGRLKKWAFVVKRYDGSYCRLRPEFLQNTIYYMEGRFEPAPTRTPNRGLGQSDGPGTYKYYKEHEDPDLLRFNTSRF